MKKNYNYNSNSRRRIPLVDKIRRAKEIWELRTKEDLTLDAIGKKYGLTRERVRQVLLWFNQLSKK